MDEIINRYCNLRLESGLTNLPLQLKPKQIEILAAVCKGEGTVGIFPTGYGKSFVFFIAPYMLGSTRNVCLVFSQLKSITNEQCREANAYGINIIILRDINDMSKEELEGDFSI